MSDKNVGPGRPTASEYHEFYDTYVSKVPEGDIFKILGAGLEETLALLKDLPEDRETFAYESGKWTVREVLGHMVDTERLFGFRALWMARGDQQGQPGMDQDAWNAVSTANERSVADHLEELALVRRSNLAMFRGFDDECWKRIGNASGFPFAVRAFPFILAGHEIHHRQVLAERYLADG